MSEIITLFSVFLTGILASIFGTLVGGGTMLSLPFLMIIGLPPQVAIATERLGGMGQSISSFLKFQKSKKIVWEYVFGLTAISLVSSVIGANILIKTSPVILRNMVGGTILVLLPLFFLKRNLGVQHTTESKKKIIIGSIVYFLIQILATFSGGGTGILAAYILMYCFGLTIIEATATKTVPWFFLSISSLVIFAIKGIIDYKVGIVMLAGMVIGGDIGARIAIEKGNIWLKRLFVLFVFISVVKLLFFR